MEDEGVVPSSEEEITRKNAIEKLNQVLSLSLTHTHACICAIVFVCGSGDITMLLCYH